MRRAFLLSVVAIFGLNACGSIGAMIEEAKKNPNVIIQGKIIYPMYVFQHVPNGTINGVVVVKGANRSSADVEREMNVIKDYIVVGKAVIFQGENLTYYPVLRETVNNMRAAMMGAAGKKEDDQIQAVWDAVRINKETGNWGFEVAKEFVKANPDLAKPATGAAQ